MCGSHIGDQDHREAVQGILEKIGLIEENLDIYKDYSLSNELRDKRITAINATLKVSHFGIKR